MNNITNAYILEKMMYGLYNTAGRRTTYSFAIAIMDTITRTLEQRYDFLKYLLFKTQSDSNEVIKINSNINFEDPIKVGKAIEAIVKVVCMDLQEKAGLYFITELRKNTDEDVIAHLNNIGIDLELLQIQQRYIYRQNKRIEAIFKENRKEDNNGKKEEKNILNYTWENVSNCEYDPINKTCTIYDKDGNILDHLDLNYIVKNYIKFLSEEDNFSPQIDYKKEDKEKYLKI
jgi:hypothetical protein